MLYPDNGFSSCYEELITYYPRFYRDVLEMRAILSAHGKLADDLQANIEQVVANSFIDTADEVTISRLERFLNLTVSYHRSLNERRSIVKSYFIGFGKISASILAEIIRSMTGTEAHIVFEPADEERNNTLLVSFDCYENTSQVLADIKAIFDRKVPAHIQTHITAIETSDTIPATIRPSPAYGAVEYITMLPKLEMDFDFKDTAYVGMHAVNIVQTELKPLEGGM